MAALHSPSFPNPVHIPVPAPSSTTTTTTTTFNIGTRKSALALAQTELVVSSLTRAWPDHTFEIHARDTAAGDLDKVTPFKDMPVKNLWTHELETLLMEGKLDLLVHSLKGMCDFIVWCLVWDGVRFFLKGSGLFVYIFIFYFLLDSA